MYLKHFSLALITRFKIKYHPEECEKRNREVKKALQHRCNVYMELMDSGRIEETWVDFEKSDELVKLLDAGKRESLGLRKIMIGFLCKHVKHCHRLKNIIIILES